MVTVSLIVSLLGCTPTCQEACTKLVECETLETERQTATECEEQCNLQYERYQTWDDIAKREAFQDELSCVGDSTCEEIGAGACYDPDIYAF